MKIFALLINKNEKNEIYSPSPNQPNISEFNYPEKYNDKSDLNKRNIFAPNISYLFNKKK